MYDCGLCDSNAAEEAAGVGMVGVRISSAAYQVNISTIQLGNCYRLPSKVQRSPA